jgi:hypothetical protein
VDDAILFIFDDSLDRANRHASRTVTMHARVGDRIDIYTVWNHDAILLNPFATTIVYEAAILQANESVVLVFAGHHAGFACGAIIGIKIKP